MDIIKIIRDYKLIYLDINKLCSSLEKLNLGDYETLREKVKSLIENGDLFLDEKGKISISKDRGYVKARIILNKKGFGFAEVEDMNDIFIPSYALNNALNGDDCLVEITNRKGDNNFDGRVVKILKNNTTHVVGTFIEGTNKDIVFPDDERLPQVRIYKEDKNCAKNNDKVWVELYMSTLNETVVRGKVLEVLGQTNTPKAEQLAIIRSFGLQEKFSDKVLSEARAISQEVELKNFPSRVDYTEQKVITIDGEDARDFDDALSIERLNNGNIKLNVHIADVSNYVPYKGAIDNEAFKRGTSVYFSNMVIPMLPKEISNGICSLSEGVNRLTLTVEITMDKNFNVKKYEVKEGVIKSSHRMTYTAVQKILNGDEFLIEKYKDVYVDILTYQAISNKLKQDKHTRGEIRMNIPEPFILENENGEIVSIEKRVQDESHEIIESLMVLTNECIAKMFYDLKLPFLYRVHEKPSEEKIEKLRILLECMGISNDLKLNGEDPKTYQAIMEKIKGDPKESTLSVLVLRSMMKARYAPTCLGHFGLASEFYCHFTSPIRRYPDLTIHRIIKDYIHGVPKQDIKLKYEGFVEFASEKTSETEKNADEAEREVDDYKKAVYMSKFLGEEFDGLISGVQEFGVFVELENGVEGLVRLEDLPMDEYTYDDMTLTLYGANHHFTIGDKLRIVVAKTDTRLRQIDFALAGNDILSGGTLARKEKKSKKTTTKKLKSKTSSKGKRKKR
ncbi:MAG: ribonuclease R [Clostridiales bacterium]|nr:ribonuclease R [Clostridiales bacterium]